MNTYIFFKNFLFLDSCIVYVLKFLLDYVL